MKKVVSLQRRILAFAALSVVLLAVLLLRPAETSAIKPADLRPLFAKFEEAARSAATVEIERVPVAKDPKKPDSAPPPPSDAKKVVITRKDEKTWLLASSFSYPTRPGSVDRVLEALTGARRQAVMTERADTFEKYADTNGWVHVTVKDGAGKVLAAISIGKYANYPDVYVKEEAEGAAKVSRATKLSKDAFSLETQDWIEATLWTQLRSDDITRIDVEQRRDKRTMTFERTVTTPPAKEGEPPAPSETKWKMTSPKEAEAVRMDVDDLVRAFSGMRIVDIVAGPATQESDKSLGLTDPELVITAVGKKPEKEGQESPQWSLVVGNKTADGKSWHVRRQGETWVFTVSEDALERMRKKTPDSFLPKPATPPEGEKKDGEKKDGEKKDGEKKEGEKPPGEPAPAGATPPEKTPPDKTPPDKKEPVPPAPPPQKPGGPPADGSPDGDK